MLHSVLIARGSTTYFSSLANYLSLRKHLFIGIRIIIITNGNYDDDERILFGIIVSLSLENYWHG